MHIAEDHYMRTNVILQYLYAVYKEQNKLKKQVPWK